MIYFDNSATSPVDEEVLDAMLPYLREEYGNPSSKYYCKATQARNAVEEARGRVAQLLGAQQEEIVFTAGATESTNFIIKGYTDYRRYYGDGKNHIITSVAEHKATLNTCKYLNGDIYSNNDPTINLFGGKQKVDRGYEASFVGVNEYGEIVNRTTTKASDERTLKISEVILNCIQRKGYCTEKEVVYILGNQYMYEVTETQIKRSLNEIMDSYGLKKIKTNKVLKEQYHIKSDGYPNIIIEDVIQG